MARRAQVPKTVSARQFQTAAALAGWISEAEAEAWISRNALPPVVSQLIDNLPAEIQFEARMAVLGMTEVDWDSWLLVAFMQQFGANQDARDEIMRRASKL